MAKTIAQRLTALEKLVAGFLGSSKSGARRRKAKKSPRRKAKVKRAKSRTRTVRAATAMPLPPG
jgi:hypothetical protein